MLRSVCRIFELFIELCVYCKNVREKFGSVFYVVLAITLDFYIDLLLFPLNFLRIICFLICVIVLIHVILVN